MLKILTCKLITGLILLSSTNILFSQNKYSHLLIHSGIGVIFSNTASVNDYLQHSLPLTSTDSVKTFSIGAEYFGSVEYEFTNKLSLKLDYSYFSREDTYNLSFANYNYNYRVHQPYVLLNYFGKLKGSKLNIGAGVGYHFGTLTETIFTFYEKKYSSNGFAIKAEMTLALKIIKNFYFSMGVLLSNSFMNPLKDSNGNKLTHSNGKEVNLSSFNAGVRLGVLVYLF